MKIGIITYWSSLDNYGQQLQCFALQKYLRDKGHDAYLIKFIPNSRLPKWRRVAEKLADTSFFLSFFNGERKKRLARGEQERTLNKRNMAENPLRAFEQFRDDYICSTDIVYRSIGELRANPPEADLYISGSDQVWNNSLALADTAAFYLQFGIDNTRRVSYAASIGREVKRSECSLMRKYLRSFDAVSVREPYADLLCKSFGVKSEVVVDPTLLLSIEKFDAITKHEHYQEEYLFAYILNISSSDEMYWSVVEDYFKSNNLNFKICVSSGYKQARQLVPAYKNILATIPEWLALIRDARCVITTSFHGMVFCVKMHKPFLAILLTNECAKANERISAFLSTIDLQDRIYDSSGNFSEQMDATINWDKVDAKLSAHVTSSSKFLDKILS